jgi:predicted porin
VTIAGGTLMLGLLLSASGVAEAQSAAGPVQAPKDDSLTSHGITLYGLIDIGLQYITHGAPFNDYFVAGSNDIVAKNSINSQFGATPSNYSQTRIGLQGLESLGVEDWYGIFKVETYFNPQSGDIADALKSIAQNNGRSVTQQTVNLDSSIAGEIFQQSFVGLSSATYGALTFGRQNTLLADGVAKYDAQGASNAFALIGLSGTAAGGGDTQNRRLDNSLKYVGTFGPWHAGAQYKFNGAAGNASTAVEAQVGVNYLGASVDAYYVKVYDAVAASALSAAAVATLPALGLSSSNSVAGTISDNSTFSVMASYNLGKTKFYGAYEHITFANPSNPLAVGFDDIGGYKLAVVNNTAFTNNRVLQIYWAGVRVAASPKLDLAAAYYGYSQNSFATGALASCNSNASAACSGREVAVSFSADYKFSKRFDVYAGAMYTAVYEGLAAGFEFSTSTVDPTIGFRYIF